MLVISLLLVIPLLLTKNLPIASLEPSGEVFNFRKEMAKAFPSEIHTTWYIVEALDGDILTQKNLYQLKQNFDELKKIDILGDLTPEDIIKKNGNKQSYLYSGTDDFGRKYKGIPPFNIPETTNSILLKTSLGKYSLENASNEQVKTALSILFSNPDSEALKNSLSSKKTIEPKIIEHKYPINYWKAPALLFPVQSNNSLLGGVSQRGTLNVDDATLNKEAFDRNVANILKKNIGSYQLWGIAIDQNLEAQEEGQTAGYFIMATVIAAIIVVGITFRSRWATVLSAFGITLLILWLKGFSALFAIKQGLITDLVVPIAMIALGIDFAVHAIKRYQEEKVNPINPTQALNIGFKGVLGALILAMITDGIAFLSNISSGIESVLYFGIAASIGVISSFLILGLATPLALMKIENMEKQKGSLPLKTCTTCNIINSENSTHCSNCGAKFSFWIITAEFLHSIISAILAGITVIIFIALSKTIGLILLGTMFILVIVLPLIITHFRKSNKKENIPQKYIKQNMPPAISKNIFTFFAEQLIRNRIIVIFFTSIFTIVMIIQALQLEPIFDVKDFFDPKSDFVLSLDKVDEHFKKTGGEESYLFIKGNITTSKMFQSLNSFLNDLASISNIAKIPESGKIITRNIIDFSKTALTNNYTKNQIEFLSEEKIIDNNGDNLPDTDKQIKTVVNYITKNGIQNEDKTFLHQPQDINQIINVKNMKTDITRISFFITEARYISNVEIVANNIKNKIKNLRESNELLKIGLAGSAFERLETLKATTRSLTRSLIIAIICTYIILLFAFRNMRIALITTIPVILVASWLYGTMKILGFGLNFVTATVGSISIGVGIDYAVHMTQRFREEYKKTLSADYALIKAVSSTGIALFASAISSIVGFGIMAFAPMPLFATYGLLTACMILYAFLASILILPLLLKWTHK